MKTRIALLAAGLATGLWGLWTLVHTVELRAITRLPIWLAGAVIADDFLLIPLTVATGWLVTRWSTGPGHHRTVGALRTTLLYVGITTLIALPLLLRQGTGANPTILPRDYLRDWLLLEATIIAVGVISAARSRGRGPRRATSADAGRGSRALRRVRRVPRCE
ncbi:hypothetical protein [Kribbella sp. NPDC004875]|uniref:hypothetical protein n=1 Tax=Kribbella sp. NPDC004875 TaxID=3364107 RepID=UPI0036A4050C